MLPSPEVDTWMLKLKWVPHLAEPDTGEGPHPTEMLTIFDRNTPFLCFAIRYQGTFLMWLFASGICPVEQLWHKIICIKQTIIKDKSIQLY